MKKLLLVDFLCWMFFVGAVSALLSRIENPFTISVLGICLGYTYRGFVQRWFNKKQREKLDE